MDLPLLLEPNVLQSHLHTPGLLIVNLSALEVHQSYHIPGALYMDYSALTWELPNSPGPLNEESPLRRTLEKIGLTPELHVVAYDDGDSTKACRLLWTLDVIGHTHYSLLNGGLSAWLDERHPVDNETTIPTSKHGAWGRLQKAPTADELYLLTHLNRDNLTIVDVRTPEEFCGEDLRSQRGGHIPGAVNLDWRLLLDPTHSMRLHPADKLRALMLERGITPEREIIVYCQSHRRSALLYFALKTLGYPNIKAYPGSWSEWGNSLDTPIE